MCKTSILKITELQREAQELSKKRTMLCSWIGNLDIVKKSVLPKFTYGFNTVQSPRRIFQ